MIDSDKAELSNYLEAYAYTHPNECIHGQPGRLAAPYLVAVARKWCRLKAELERA